MIKITVGQDDDDFQVQVDLYGPQDAARYLDITQQTLNVWRRDGWIDAQAVGRGFYYTKDALDEANRSKRPHLFRGHDQNT